MAERRMMSKKIIDTDNFLDMPQSTQCLYFHLLLRADDDGFIQSPKSIMRITGCKDDDLKLLNAKGFVIGFETGVIVIRHWRIHNYVQSDRYSKSELPEAKCVELKNKIYEVVGQPMNPVNTYMDTKCIQNGYNLDTQIRIDKIREEENRIETICHVSHDDVDKSHFEIIEYLNLKTGSKFKPTTKPYVQAIRSRLKEGYTVDDFKTVIDKKCREWKGTKLEKYLTPKTLFAPSHFDTYLNSNEMAAMTDTERKVAELNALIDAVERGTDEGTKYENVGSYGPIIDISEY
nr:MAG TPA: replisome organizer [Caudoviricetes sp.]